MSNEEEQISELSGAEWNSLESLARETDMPLIEVASLYKVERAFLRDDAKISTYIPVVAVHKVRIRLKHLHH